MIHWFRLGEKPISMLAEKYVVTALKELPGWMIRRAPQSIKDMKKPQLQMLRCAFYFLM